MKAMAASYAETNFSNVLARVRNGEKFKILHGSSEEPVAMIVPIENKATREIGILNEKAKIRCGRQRKDFGGRVPRIMAYLLDTHTFIE